jgi:DNA-binding NtrC family response regulator
MEERLGKMLIVDDDEDFLTAARHFLKQHSPLVHAERDPELLAGLLRNETYDIVLLDINFTRDVSSGKEGFFWVDRMLEIEPSSVVVLITAYGDDQMAVRAIKAGGADFILKPWHNEQLLGENGCFPCAILSAASGTSCSLSAPGSPFSLRRQ